MSKIFIINTLLFVQLSIFAQNELFDLYNDQNINTSDFLLFLPDFGNSCSTPCKTDFNANGVVDTEDFLLFLPAFNRVVAIDQPIMLNETNPHYFTYKGVPTVIVTSGEHYGAVLNADFDYETYLDQLALDGLNGTKISSGANVEYQGWYDMPENTWAPQEGSYLSPWARSNESGYFHGGNKFDLTDWDENYFTRLHSFMASAEQRGLIVELSFFTYIYNATLWQYNPMNYINNINGVGNVVNSAVYTTTNTKLLAVQKALVEKIVTELNHYNNLIYEIINEPYMNPAVPGAWQDYMIKVIVDTEAGLSKQHLISQNVNNFSYTIISPNPETDLFNLHYANTSSAYTNNWSINKALGCNETGDVTGGGTGETQYRKECYLALINGAAYFNNLDFSFTVGDEEGRVLPSGARGSGGPAIREQIKIAKEFIESFDFIDMAPDVTCISSVSSGVSVSGLRETGQQYAIYFNGKTSFVQLSLPGNNYTVEWVNTRTGAITYSALAHAGGNVTLYPPSYSEDIALRIKKFEP